MPSQYPLTPDSEHLKLSPGMRRVTVTTASTPELIDLASLRYDFSSAKMFAQSYLLQDFEALGPKLDASDALWIAALTLYGRAFANGLRHRGRASTDGFDQEMQQAHDFFIDTRNKFIAHSVNAFEVGAVFVDLNPREEAPGMSKIGEVHTSVTRLSRETVGRLSALCDHHIRSLTLRIEGLHQNIGQELLAMGEEAVYSFPTFVPPLPDGSNPRSART